MTDEELYWWSQRAEREFGPVRPIQWKVAVKFESDGTMSGDPTMIAKLQLDGKVRLCEQRYATLKDPFYVTFALDLCDAAQVEHPRWAEKAWVQISRQPGGYTKSKSGEKNAVRYDFERSIVGQVLTLKELGVPYRDGDAIVAFWLAEKPLVGDNARMRLSIPGSKGVENMRLKHHERREILEEVREWLQADKNAAIFAATWRAQLVPLRGFKNLRLHLSDKAKRWIDTK